MEKKNINHIAKPINRNESTATATNEQNDTLLTAIPEKRPRNPRRPDKKIQAEFEEFKALYKEGRPILEIIRTMGIGKSQADSCLRKISLEQQKRALRYGVCEGHCLPESIRDILGGDRDDLFKFEPFKDEDGHAVRIKLHISCK